MEIEGCPEETDNVVTGQTLEFFANFDWRGATEVQIIWEIEEPGGNELTFEGNPIEYTPTSEGEHMVTVAVTTGFIIDDDVCSFTAVAPDGDG